MKSMNCVLRGSEERPRTKGRANWMIVLQASLTPLFPLDRIPGKDNAMATLTVEEAQTRLPQLLDEQVAGDEVVIVRDGKPVECYRPSCRRECRSLGAAEEKFRG